MTARARRRFHVTLWAVCCLLVSQTALASHVCAAIRLAGNVTAPMQIETETAAGPACHGVESVTAEVPADRTAICMKHCADESATPGGALTVAALATAPPPLIRTLVPDTPPLAHWEQAPAGADATAPPLSILYCVFLR